MFHDPAHGRKAHTGVLADQAQDGRHGIDALDRLDVVREAGVEAVSER
ncbi:hypothetical protein [Paraburkholderia fynbosensis]|nr:hypothetical protein [Paraburkholderia fynbosensis]